MMANSVPTRPIQKSPILKKSLVTREFFDPKNKKHRESFKKFLTTGGWGDIHFFPELPFVTVPETVMRKFCLFNLEKNK